MVRPMSGSFAAGAWWLALMTLGAVWATGCQDPAPYPEIVDESPAPSPADQIDGGVPDEAVADRGVDALGDASVRPDQDTPDSAARDSSVPDAADEAAPDLGVAEPDMDRELPDLALSPDMVAPEPDMVAPEPDMAVEAPDMAAPEPDMAVEEPDQAVADAEVELDMAPDAEIDIEPDMAPDAAVVDAELEPDMAWPPVCEPVLAAVASPEAARPFDLVTVLAAGGTGAYRFEFVENLSGALLNEVTGAYLAGAVPGVVDRIRLVDDGCEGEVIIPLPVVEPLIVQPAEVSVQVEDAFQFDVQRGSGEYAFELLLDLSGAVIDQAGAYAAGPLPGQDVVRVTDLLTTEAVDVAIEVVADPVALVVDPPRLYLPVGAEMPLRASGGSEVYAVEGEAEVVRVADGLIEGLAPGRTVLTLTDRFLGHTVQMRVDVVESLQGDMPVFNSGDALERLLPAGDLNDDGWPDLLVADGHSNVFAGRGGALYVLHGSAEGFVERPAQVLGNGGRNDWFGHGIAIGDVDRDGHTDLVAGARLADIGTADNGAVFIHRGRADGTFDEQPSHVLAGPRSGDHSGFSVGVCDFNGDGLLDVASGAILYEDNTLVPRPNSQGGVLIWLGYEDGFLERPDDAVTGVRLTDEGEWVPDGGQLFGLNIATGDIDGDGLCDLVAASPNFRDRRGGRNRANAGAAFVYRGRPADGLSPGGLQPSPSLFIYDDSDSQTAFLGRGLAVGDLNGDGRDDIVLGATQFDPRTLNAGNNNAGAAFVFAGRALPPEGASQPISLADANTVIYGNSPGDQLGQSATVGDVNGDGVGDLLVGAFTEDFPGMGDAGAIYAFFGVPDDWPAPDVGLILTGPEQGALLGYAVAVLPDITGDGFDDVVGFADRSDGLGRDLGDGFVFAGGPPGQVIPEEGAEPVPEGPRPPLARLPLPAAQGHSLYGYGVGLIGDADGDGLGDAAVGAPIARADGAGNRTGFGAVYLGDAAGIAPDPAARLGGWTGHGGYDFGFAAVGPAGDVDGDGRDDWFALHRDDELFNLGDASLWVPDECRNEAGQARYWYRGRDDGALARINNGGGLWIFRGTDDGIADRPSYVAWPRMVNAQPEAAAGGGDFDGDGHSDLVVGGFRFDAPGAGDAGAIEVFLGRPAPPEGRVRVLCERAFTQHGTVGADQLGRSVALSHDVDGDGCAELAAGGIFFDREVTSTGAAWLVTGFGARCATEDPRILQLSTARQGDQLGGALAMGDLTADGVPELAVGGFNMMADDRSRRGGVWVVPGDWMAEQLALAEPVPNPRDVTPVEGGEPIETWLPYLTTHGVIADVDAGGVSWRLLGRSVGERFGNSIAIIDGWLGVGAPFGAESDVPRVGTVRIHRARPDGTGIEQRPWALFVGETWRSDGQNGVRLGAGRAGDGPGFIVGGPFGQGNGLDNGSAYILRLE